MGLAPLSAPRKDCHDWITDMNHSCFGPPWNLAGKNKGKVLEFFCDEGDDAKHFEDKY
jgi:hypothetical protein